MHITHPIINIWKKLHLNIPWQDVATKAAPIRGPPRPVCRCCTHCPTVKCVMSDSFKYLRFTLLYPVCVLPLRRLLQPGSFPRPSTQEGVLVPYCPKAHNQHDQNYNDGHRGLPGPLMGILSPISTCGKGWSTIRLHSWRCSWGPCSHQNLRPQNRNTNGHQ